MCCTIPHSKTEKQYFLKFEVETPITLTEQNLVMVQVSLNENETASLMIFSPDGSLIGGK